MIFREANYGHFQNPKNKSFLRQIMYTTCPNETSS